MPHCQRCGAAPITIMFGAYPLVFCSGCGARWTQTGGERRAIKRVQEPALFALARRWRPARWQRQRSTRTSPHDWTEPMR
jgi:hypothetical protein